MTCMVQSLNYRRSLDILALQAVWQRPKMFKQSVAHQQPILPPPVLTPESTVPFMTALAKQFNISRLDKGQGEVCQKEFAVPYK